MASLPGRQRRAGLGVALTCSLALLGIGVHAQSATSFTADLNLDGHPDEVFIEGGAIVVALADGADGFFEPVRYEPGLEPSALKIADLNEDGIPDLVVTSPGEISIFLGSVGPDAEHSFEEAHSYPVALDPESLTLTDVDENGTLDIVVASGDQALSLLGVGDGAFAPAAERASDTEARVADEALAGAQPNPAGPVALAETRPSRVSAPTFSSLGAVDAPVQADLFDGSCPLSSFDPLSLRTVGDGAAEALAVADWDGDGQDDVLTIDSALDTVDLYRGQGGTFVYEYDVATLTGFPGFPAAVLARDLDANGWPDLVVVAQGLDNVQVFLRSGTGTVLAPAVVPVGSAPAAAVLHDLDADGIDDLAVTNSGSANVSVFLGTGSGSFVASPQSPLPLPGAVPWGIVAGDFDENGLADLVVVDQNGPVWLFSNHPAGFNTTATNVHNAGAGASQALAGYFDFGTTLDLVVLTDDATLDANDAVRLLGGNGDGTFSPGASYPVPGSPWALAAGDLNGDARPDIAVTDSGSGPMRVLLGQPAGGFFPVVDSLAGVGQGGVAVDDVTGDGLDDVIVGNVPGIRMVASSPTGDGTLGQPYRPLLKTDFEPTAVALDDVNGDAAPDLIVVDSDAGEISVHLNLGDGTFGTHVTYSLGGFPEAVAIAQFDGDANGFVDLAVRDSSELITVVPGNGDGTFNIASQFQFGINGGFASAWAWGYFDADGLMDLAVVKEADFPDTDHQVQVFLGPLFSLMPADFAIASSEFAVGAAVGDLNGDTDLDLVVLYDDFPFAYFQPFLGDGTGDLADDGTPVDLLDFSPTALVVGAFDADANADVAVAGAGLAGASLFVHTGDGTGEFPGDVTYPVHDYPLTGSGFDVVAGDWDGDLQLQLAAAEGEGESVGFTPTGALDPSNKPIRFSYALDGSVVQVVAGNVDLDLDGRTDIVALEDRGFGSTKSVAVLYNTNCQMRRLGLDWPTPTCPTPGTLAPQPQVRITDDAANTVPDATGNVTAAMGWCSASLSGSPAPPAFGLATFTDLATSNTGRRCFLEFTHDTRKARSDTFSQAIGAVPPTISGQSLLCSTDVTPATPAEYFTDPWYDTYSWVLDAPASPLPSTTAFATVTSIAPGGRTLDVSVTQDGCPVSAPTFNLTVEAPLSNLGNLVTGAVIVPADGAGGTGSAVPTGGGVIAYQWGYRHTPGGAISTISGATASSYPIQGVHFDGGTAGTYYLVVTGIPGCGPTLISNEVPITVYTPTGQDADAVRLLTATSWPTQNTLEWVNPDLGSAYAATRIQYTEGASCVAPTGLNEGTLLVRHVGVAGQKDTYTDGGLSPAMTRCYALFVETTALGVSPGRDVKARTVTAGAAWAFTTHLSVVTSPGVGPGVIYVVSNDGHLYSVVSGGAGGLWPAGWTPKALADPSEGRPTSIPLSGGTGPVVYLGSGDGGGGGLLYAIDPATGGDHYAPVPLANRVQATPSGIFSEFGGGMDLVLAGTRNSTGPSSLYALDPATGTQVWRYEGADPTDPDLDIGIISAQPSVDYVGQRVYFTSDRFNPSADSVWCVDLATGTRCAPSWTPPALGDLSTSPVPRGTTLYVAPASPATNQTVRALSAVDGTAVWGWNPGPLDGPVKGFIFPAYGTNDIYFSTDTRVWCGTDTGTGLTPKWSTGPAQAVDIPNPSTPVLAVERNEVWVGGGDGRLYRLDATLGTELSPSFNLNPGVQLTSPTVDRDGGYVYVGAVDGRVFALPLP